ncbi:MAG: hypothetical protein HQK96_03750 [Nitrospirae bacterium]|nr:hypothetical protein [Nitrospirota bacterium]
MKKIIGFTMIILFFVGIFVAITIGDGIKMAVMVYGTTAVIIVFIVIALYLITSDDK